MQQKLKEYFWSIKVKRLPQKSSMVYLLIILIIRYLVPGNLSYHLFGFALQNFFQRAHFFKLRQIRISMYESSRCIFQLREFSEVAMEFWRFETAKLRYYTLGTGCTSGWYILIVRHTLVLQRVIKLSCSSRREPNKTLRSNTDDSPIDNHGLLELDHNGRHIRYSCPKIGNPKFTWHGEPICFG